MPLRLVVLVRAAASGAVASASGAAASAIDLKGTFGIVVADHQQLVVVAAASDPDSNPRFESSSWWAWTEQQS